MISLEVIRILEMRFKEETFPGNTSFEITNGITPVLVSAPHSVNHYRNGKPKQGEFLTGVMAKLIQERLNCFCITKTKNDLTDPNYDPYNLYKEAIKEIVKANDISLLIDLHIMASRRKAEIEIGTGRGKNVFHDNHYAEVLKHNFERVGISPIFVDKRFTGGYIHTVSSSISKETSIPCIQIEVNWRIIDLDSSSNKFNELLVALELSIKSLIS